MGKQEYIPNEEQDKLQGEKKRLNEMELSNLLGKEFKVIIRKMLTNLEKGRDEYKENFNEEIENIRKYQTDVTELNNKYHD